MQLKLTICYDNTILAPQYKSEWGFACVLHFSNETVLFDTGGMADILLHNLSALNIPNDQFSKIIISHKDWDHIGGLETMAKLNPNAALYLPISAQTEIKLKEKRVTWINDAPMQISEHIHSLGEQIGARNEQSIVIKSTDGLVIITGCAHPGIIEIVERAKQQFPNEQIDLVVGGFHLKALNANDSMQIVQQLKKNVRRISPTHCTGDLAITQFQSIFGQNFIAGGVGRNFEFQLEE